MIAVSPGFDSIIKKKFCNGVLRSVVYNVYQTNSRTQQRIHSSCLTHTKNSLMFALIESRLAAMHAVYCQV